MRGAESGKYFNLLIMGPSLIYINSMPPIRCHLIEEGNNPEITSLWRQHSGLGTMNSELKN